MTAEYWRARAEADMDAAQEAAEARIARIRRAHLQAARELTEQIEKIVGRYQERFGLTREEALTRLKEPVDEDSRAYGYRVSRAEALRQAAEEQARKLDALERKEMDACFAQTAAESARRAGRMLAGLGFRTPDTAGFVRAIDTSWAGRNYAKSIWRNTQALAQTLDAEITAAFLSGKSNAAIERVIMDRFAVEFRQAERLVRTETAYVANQAAIEQYRHAGLEQFEFLTAKDSRTCPICMRHDGEVRSLSDAMPGETMPPLHPNCRCTVLPVVAQADETE